MFFFLLMASISEIINMGENSTDFLACTINEYRCETKKF